MAGSTIDERQDLGELNADYAEARPPAVRRLAETVLGTEVAYGYTTVDQADELAALLRLGPESRVLELGAGLGWPGVRLASSTGCRLVTTDMAAKAMAAARNVFDEARVLPSPHLCAADGATLPFRACSFDAVVHADVLC